MGYKVLVIEDDKSMRESLSDLLAAAKFDVSLATNARDGLRKMAAADVVLSDVRMPGMSGLELLDAATDAPPIVLISAHGDVPTAVAAMQAGAYTFFEKPFEPRRLLQALGHAAEQHALKREAESLRAQVRRLSGLDRRLIGTHAKIATVRSDIETMANLDEPVLILGETGTGKDLCATLLHEISKRSDGQFVAVNCATLTAETLEAQLFGAEGPVRRAQGGTLFLDEIGAASQNVQSQLLRFVERQDAPFGEPLAPIRIIAATNLASDELMSSSGLRDDLYYRLAPLQLALPPLRHRSEDVSPLLTHFAAEYARAHGLDAPHLDPDDLKLAIAHPWPGNVRELRGVALRWVLGIGRGDRRLASALHLNIASGTPQTLREAVASFEREMISNAMRDVEGSLDDVAERLGIGRRTLNEKLSKLGLSSTD